MIANFRTANLAELIMEADLIAQDVEHTFGDLNATQLNWKPAPTEWSVGQCFDHLTIVTGSYLPLMRSLLGGTKRQSFWEKLPVLPGVWANFLLGVVDPINPTPAPAPPSWKPSESTIAADIIAKFLACHAQCTQLLRASDKIDLTRTVSSPSAAFITYSVLNAYRITISHERLHMGQAQRVMQQAGFPR